MKEWKKPVASESNYEGLVKECTNEELRSIEGGVKIGTCAFVGLGGDFSSGKNVFFGMCYVVGL